MSNLNRTPLINRRLEFIVNEIKSPDPKYDQSIIFTLRALSNFTTFGKDAGSFKAKILNKNISVKAANLRLILNDDKAWAAQTINEHPVPLRFMWGEWIKNASITNADTVWSDLSKHTMITVTKEEDAALRFLAKKTKEIGMERYRLAEIELLDIKYID
ncbi:hypothetical protein MCEMAEM4_00461 [Burkholderiaceae bacterium]